MPTFFAETKNRMRVATRASARILMFVFLLVGGQAVHAEEKMSIAAAADLKFAIDEIVLLFRSAHPAAQIETTYGSSGQFSTQIRQGAP